MSPPEAVGAPVARPVAEEPVPTLPGLLDALAGAEAAGAPLALLRPPDPEPRFVEVDLLAATRRRGRLRRALAGRGFVPLRAWGHGSHRFFLRYDPETREWLKLDVVTAVRGADAAGVLAAGGPAAPLRRLDLDVELALVALHCMVDKDGRLGRHAARLEAAAAEPPPPPPGCSQALRRLWPELWETIETRDRAKLERLAPRVSAAAASRGTALREAGDRLLRRALYARRAIRPDAPTLLVTAPTNAARIADRLATELGHPCKRVHAPDRPGPTGALRLRATLEVARRRSANPVVVDGRPGQARLARADVAVVVPAVTDGGVALEPLAREVSEAVWRAWRGRLRRGIARRPRPRRPHRATR